MRLFISINFDEKTKSNILSIQNKLKEYGRGNFTKENNLHLTLAFLGEIDINDLNKIKEAMNEIEIPNMKLIFSKIGCFKKESELWWIGIEDNIILNNLQKELSLVLRNKGFKLDGKKFKPHITLSREMHTKLSKEELKFKSFSFETNKINLMLSSRENGKLVYTSIYER